MLFQIVDAESHDRKWILQNCFTLLKILFVSTTNINFTSITWKTIEIWGIENQENEKFFDDNRKLTNLFPVGLIYFDTTKETLSTGIDLVLK